MPAFVLKHWYLVEINALVVVLAPAAQFEIRNYKCIRGAFSSRTTCSWYFCLCIAIYKLRNKIICLYMCFVFFTNHFLKGSTLQIWFYTIYRIKTMLSMYTINNSSKLLAICQRNAPKTTIWHFTLSLVEAPHVTSHQEPNLCDI